MDFNKAPRKLIFLGVIFIIFRLSFDSKSDDTDLNSSSTKKAKAGVLLFDGCGNLSSPPNALAKALAKAKGKAPVLTDNNNNNSSSASADAEGGSTKFCSDEHHRAVEFCSNNDNNKVLSRDDAQFTSWGQIRPYSISPTATLTPGTSTSLPICRTLNDYLSSIKLGTRYWPDSNNSNSTINIISSTATANDQKPSIFVPHGCHVPNLPPPPNKTCAVLNQYTHVLFHGDSLTRHLRMAIYMSMKGDFTSGGIMTGNQQVLDGCQCDGQFSEARICRNFDGYFEETVQPNHISGGAGGGTLSSSLSSSSLCPNANFLLGKRSMAPWLPRRGKVDPGGSIDWSQINCHDPAYKGALLFLQGGLHYNMNATDTFNKMIQPVIAHPQFEECLCRGKVRLVWESRNAQSRALDEYYPRQSRENGLVFNGEIRQLFELAGLIPGEEVLILDWWNLTADAQSSDGLHYLSDVNLAKAAHLLYLLEHWPYPKSYRAEAGSC